jgi:putative DNA primase/helicase
MTAEPNPALYRLTDKLKAAGLRVSGSKAQCPAHNDRRESLSLSQSAKSPGVLLHCHAGCSTEDVVNSLGLRLRDLFVNVPETTVSDEIIRYPYTTATGRHLFDKCRRKPKVMWFEPVSASPSEMRKVPLYNLPQVLAAARTGQCVFIVEGEKDADRLNSLGYVATCNYDGAGGKWHPHYTEALRGAEVVIIADNDDPGYAHAEKIAAALRSAGL